MTKKIPFTKMVGAGNDFIIVDHPGRLNLSKLAMAMCHRTNGIGADGLLVLSPSRKADYRMRIINADGSEAEMCGNGARCMAVYIVGKKKLHKKSFCLQTIAGKILCEAKKEIAQVRLSDPADYKEQVLLRLKGGTIQVSYIDSGVPHTIVYVDRLDKISVPRIGREIRQHRKFKPRGTNVNFVEQLEEDLVAIRTYERGVEDETRACGTGSVAAALITYLRSNPDCVEKKKAFMRVLTQSGEILNVTFDISRRQPLNVWLKGSARFIAQGTFSYR